MSAPLAALTPIVIAAEGGITTWVWVALVIGLFLIIANGFFVALEFALIATQKSQLEAKVAAGDKRAVKAMASITDLNAQVAGAQLGITLASIALGYLAEPSIAAIVERIMPFLGDGLRHVVAIIIAYTIVTMLHMVIGEMVPKNIALADPAGLAMRLAPLHGLFVRATHPVIRLLNATSNVIVSLLGVEALDERGEARTPAELASLIESSRGEGVLDEFEHSLLSGALDLRNSRVDSEMVRWENVATVDVGASIDEIEQCVLASGHSRLPAIDAAGAVAGWVHAKDLLHFPVEEWQQAYPVERLHTPLRVTEGMNLEQVLLRMQRGRRHFALVLDSDGQTAGIITLEDVLESVVGEIVDETDRHA